MFLRILIFFVISVVSWGRLLQECTLLCTRNKREIFVYFTRTKSTNPLTWGRRKQGLYAVFLLPIKPVGKRWRTYANILRSRRGSMLWRHSMFNYYSK